MQIFTPIHAVPYPIGVKRIRTKVPESHAVIVRLINVTFETCGLGLKGLGLERPTIRISDCDLGRANLDRCICPPSNRLGC